MKIISSQHYIDPEIVEEKISELEGLESVEIPCSYVGEIDGVECAIQSDGHHTLAAARELGLTIIYAVVDDPDGLTGEDLLNARWMDGDYYDVERSNPYYDEFDLIW